MACISYSVICVMYFSKCEALDVLCTPLIWNRERENKIA